VELLVLLVFLAGAGAGIGALARLILPGSDPMPLWVMIAIGLVAGIVGGVIGYAILNGIGAVVLAVGGAVGLVYLYRRWKRRRTPTPAAAQGEATTLPAAAPVSPAADAATELQATQDRFCASCGSKFEGDERFCTNCGAPRS
jgi:hypothetical protein